MESHREYIGMYRVREKKIGKYYVVEHYIANTLSIHYFIPCQPEGCLKPSLSPKPFQAVGGLGLRGSRFRVYVLP